MAATAPLLRESERFGYLKPKDVARLEDAYRFSEAAHAGQTRQSGDPYISHPLAVAEILADWHLDGQTLMAALLHDVTEDTSVTKDEISDTFGKPVAELVDGVSKLDKIEFQSAEDAQAENFRKMLLAMARDVRVILIKLADRLHNMRTLEFVPPASRRRIAEETLDIYAPLAGRMGMQEMREELEDLSFRELNPDAYKVITERLETLAERSKAWIAEIEQQLTRKLADSGIAAEVTGRRKRAYSIWRKMERKAVGFEQLSDIFGFRVVVAGVAECYQALGIVHMTWPVVPGRFKDYISTPKQNDYRSIHSTVIGPGKQRVELQIRTREMHQIAEYGIAAHALYKDGLGSPTELLSRESKAYAWLRRTIELLAEGSNPEEFLEHTKLELFQDQVFCFTPKGKLIALPRGATPIDFAYFVHTDVGNTAVGAKVNGVHTPLHTPLKNGDQVEIICSREQTPSPLWERFVVTGRARAEIRRYLSDDPAPMFARTFGRSSVPSNRASHSPKTRSSAITLPWLATWPMNLISAMPRSLGTPPPAKSKRRLRFFLEHADSIGVPFFFLLVSRATLNRSHETRRARYVQRHPSSSLSPLPRRKNISPLHLPRLSENARTLLGLPSPLRTRTRLFPRRHVHQLRAGCARGRMHRRRSLGYHRVVDHQSHRVGSVLVPAARSSHHFSRPSPVDLSRPDLRPRP
jgi:ppGpp synthetase/RelA/SpoT-type nucleotidyltranferase